MSSRFALLLLLLAVSGTAFGGSFARYHPDQYFFDLGMADYKAQRYESAFERFRNAARHADKPSQLAVAMMLHQGLGLAKDAALAYAWSDLAAERGYPQFLQVRERIWAELTPAERERALQVGQALYAEFGDAAAKPRLERLLRLGLAQKTGSRAGGDSSGVGVIDLSTADARAAFIAGLFTIESPEMALAHGASAAASARANAFRAGDYYDVKNWRPEAYWGYQDALWLGAGRVEVKPLRPVDAGDQGQ
jgi:hypothetical protein